MADISVTPIMLKDASLVVDSDNYAAAVTQVLFVPQVRWGWVDTFVGSTPVVERVNWVCQIGFVQDFAAASLTTYLLSNVGETKLAVFTPDAGGPSVSATLMLVPPTLGGVPNQQLTSTITLPVVGEPSTSDSSSA